MTSGSCSSWVIAFYSSCQVGVVSPVVHWVRAQITARRMMLSEGEGLVSQSRASRRCIMIHLRLRMAAGRGRLRPGRIAHSDRGTEYTSSQIRCLMNELRLRQSCG